MSDLHGERAPEGLRDPAASWGTLGTHSSQPKGARARVGGRKEWRERRSAQT